MSSRTGLGLLKNISVSESLRLCWQNSKSSLKRNFLLNEKFCDKIIRLLGNVKETHVCEVYPGPGVLTKAIVDAGAAHLSAIENDDVFFPHLEELEVFFHGKIKIYRNDIYTLDLRDIFPSEIAKTWEDESTPNAHIVGNIPFSYSTALVLRWLKEIALKEGFWSKGRVPLTIGIQKEVADKMVAKAKDNKRCKLSVYCQNWCQVDHKFTIPSKVFSPPTRDDVAIMQLTPRINPEIDVPYQYVDNVLCNVFQSRVRMCSSGLQTLFPRYRPELTKELLGRSGVYPCSRPFALNMDEFAKLCRAYKSICDREPSLLNYSYRRSVALENENECYD